MELNGAAIASANRGFHALFLQGFQGASPFTGELAMTVPSNTSVEEYHIAAGLPQMREWIGEREIQNLARYFQTVKNRKFEVTVSVKEDHFEDDQLGMYTPQFTMLGMQAALHPDILLVELLDGGFTTTKSYDDVTFFATTHPRVKGATTESNKGTAVLADSAFEAAIRNLRERKDHRGNVMDLFSMGARPALIVPPALEAAAKEIVVNERLASGASNPNYKAADLKVWNRLSSTTAWFLVLQGLPYKPFIFQRRRAARLVAMNQPTDEAVFMSGEVRYGVDGRWAMAPGFWQLMYGSTGAG